MFNNLIAHSKVYFKYSVSEQRQLFLTAIIFGFILSFRMWGGDTFNAILGFTNWFFSTIIIISAMLIQFTLQKMAAIDRGYTMKFHWWLPGVLIGLLLSFISFGFIPFLFPNSVYYKHDKKLRLGHFRYGTNMREISTLSIWGVVGNIGVAMLVGLIYLQFPSYLLLLFVKLNLLFAFFSMLPIPTISGMKLGDGSTPGFTIFFFSRQLYVFIFASLICYIGLIYFLITILNSFWLLLLAAVLGAIIFFFFSRIIDGNF